MRQDKMKCITFDKNWIDIRKEVCNKSPLIHCITNPISINDCANVVLSLGAKPIMAEHPSEVSGITANSSALAVNLGNITDARIESIKKSGIVARDNNIPSIIDVVGVACSDIRMELAKAFIDECKPSVIKGNVSEIKALFGISTKAFGIDVSVEDEVTDNDDIRIKQISDMVRAYSKASGGVVVASGKVDIISNGKEVYLIDNGSPMLAMVTGTGCMLNVIIGSFLAVTEPIKAVVLGTTLLGVSGEIAETDKGTGTFHVNLIDAINTLTNDMLINKSNVYMY